MAQSIFPAVWVIYLVVGWAGLVMRKKVICNKISAVDFASGSYY